MCPVNLAKCIIYTLLSYSLALRIYLPLQNVQNVYLKQILQ